MGRTVTAAIVCLLAAGVVAAGGVGGPGENAPAVASGDATAATGGERAVESDRVRVAAGDDGVDVGVALDWGGVSLSADDDDGGGDGRVTHGAIDRGAAAAGRAGACAVGFASEESPLDLAFDPGNDSFVLAWAANATSGSAGSGSAGGESVDAGAVVAQCSSADGG